MHRIFLAAAIVLATFFASSSAQAFHGGHGGFHGGGFHGGGGFGGFGHHGFGGFGNRGFGYGGFGGYRGIGYGGWGYRGLGYGGYFRGYYPGFGYGLGLGLGYGGFGYGYPYYGNYGYGYPSYGGYGGYGGFGYGGYGYPYSAGYGGYGYGYPAYNVGYSPWYGCYNTTPTTGTTVGIGYPTGPTVGTYVPSGSLVAGSSPVVTSVVIGAPTAARSQAISASPTLISRSSPPTPAVLQAFLGLKDIHPVSLAPAAALAVTSPTLVAPAATSLKGISPDFVSNLESRTRAERLLKEGDELFRAQNYDSALQRYKLAVSTTPDLAEALWRQGHALVATHQYDLATRAFKRAIALTDNLGRGGFRLSDLYVAAGTTKAEHLESLAEWAAKDNSADRYFLVGIFLNYDNQAARADKFFQRASELAGMAGGHIEVFLEPTAESSAPAVLERVVKPAASPPILLASMATEV